jgi:hypothetical protein
VSGTSCSNGKRLVRAFDRCRHGKAGRCARVLGYRCTEHRFDRIPRSTARGCVAGAAAPSFASPYEQLT